MPIYSLKHAVSSNHKIRLTSCAFMLGLMKTNFMHALFC